MSQKTTSSLTLRLRIWTKGSQVTQAIESFLQLGFTAKVTVDTTIARLEPERDAVYTVVLTTNSETSLNRESWSRLFSLLTSLSPISLSLSFSGLSEQEWTSPVSSLGTLFLANTYLQEIEEGLSISIPSHPDEVSEMEKKALSRLSYLAGYARQRSQNHGS